MGLFGAMSTSGAPHLPNDRSRPRIILPTFSVRFSIHRTALSPYQ